MRKKINLLKLSNLQMKNTKAGQEVIIDIGEVCTTPNNCGCLCCYANSGGSSTSANCSANHVNGQLSEPCPPAP